MEKIIYIDWDGDIEKLNEEYLADGWSVKMLAPCHNEDFTKNPFYVVIEKKDRFSLDDRF